MHETKHCPRCGAPFECQVTNLPHCQCVGIPLAAPVLDQLSAVYDDCLCAACLRALATGTATVPPAAAGPDSAAPTPATRVETPPCA